MAAAGESARSERGGVSVGQRGEGIWTWKRSGKMEAERHEEVAQVSKVPEHCLMAPEIEGEHGFIAHEVAWTGATERWLADHAFYWQEICYCYPTKSSGQIRYDRRPHSC